MLFNDTYKTINQPATGIFRDKGSKFIATAYPIKSTEEVKPIIEKLRTEHPKANHHCWALRLTTDRSNYKFSDDGEPSGTAGRPILNSLLSADITNIVVVVTRYFGGTLLGVTGLINAYKASTIEVLNQAEIIEKTINDIYQFSFDHIQMNPIMRIIKERNLKIRAQSYTHQNVIEVEIRRSAVKNSLEAIENFRDIEIKYLYSD